MYSPFSSTSPFGRPAPFARPAAPAPALAARRQYQYPRLAQNGDPAPVTPANGLGLSPMTTDVLIALIGGGVTYLGVTQKSAFLQASGAVVASLGFVNLLREISA